VLFHEVWTQYVPSINIICGRLSTDMQSASTWVPLHLHCMFVSACIAFRNFIRSLCNIGGIKNILQFFPYAVWLTSEVCSQSLEVLASSWKKTWCSCLFKMPTGDWRSTVSARTATAYLMTSVIVNRAAVNEQRQQKLSRPQSDLDEGASSWYFPNNK
jgi:hypothetical protein